MPVGGSARATHCERFRTLFVASSASFEPGVSGTDTLYHFDRDDVLATLSAMQQASTQRTLDFLSEPDPSAGGSINRRVKRRR